MRWAPIVLIISFLLSGSCNNVESISKNNVKQPTDSTLTMEAIVLGKHEKTSVTQLLITEDLDNPEIASNLNKIAEQPSQDIIKSQKYDLFWLDLKNVSDPDEIIQDLKVGSKIRFKVENEQLDTMPPTITAQEIQLIDSK
ncbi:hypothetical protein SAMN05428987_5086 [Paenibacillus sp. CF095]|uniref:hypothetical protein n=1 Tax=Paenibacillus sp. CF095 TaxID=1881033 RepID=UPI00087FA059|nr:hypothetical protein [Paenibacillus sp. CF095]SDD51675.1 hypothetical protein SAMN05428987_5086 [Paenibacillus sp. CF095]